MDKTQENSGANTRETLLAEIERLEKRIEAYNAHWMNHKHSLTILAVVIMAFIFTGMLFPALEIVLWSICGGILLFAVFAMVFRQREAASLNRDVESARLAFKEYERGRRKKN